MLKEVADLYQLLEVTHLSVERLLEDVTDEEFGKSPQGMNSLASIIDHCTLVERKFMQVVSGESSNLDTQAPFKAPSRDAATVRQDFADVLMYSKDVLSKLKDSSVLDTFGLKLGGNEIDKRQLIVYAITHNTHHRGQIPLVKRLLR